MSEPADAPDDDAAPPRRLELDVDLVPEQTVDDTDAGWGASPSSGDDVTRWYLEERPPHHGG